MTAKFTYDNALSMRDAIDALDSATTAIRNVVESYYPPYTGDKPEHFAMVEEALNTIEEKSGELYDVFDEPDEFIDE